ncbi:phage tail protein [Moraxella caviae]|uniref:NlpC/P60 family n=1 Tax=Moraxella caviae TaxID=34060 RepID=A0A1T0A3R1_9GAMM|nr:C40 family peptidase [Moraxella caviae]OOR90238.1 phage tail protein [Moraxella caviae]STZ14541.1 NlpC/P60 family [Moraxella caviae]VEW12546.1 NlpC/P60 family [Moraxella caviae]
MKLTQTLKNQILTHYQKCLPKECCGVIIKTAKQKHYVPCANLAYGNDSFILDPSDWVAAEGMGEIIAIVHSHPNGDILPSDGDRLQMSLHGVPWVITNGTDFGVYEPDDYTAPLLGREYHHGLLDCYSLVRDYYNRELNIKLPDFTRTDSWWEDEHHEPLYQNNFEKAGFIQVQDLKPYDVILCRVGRTHHINHALVYLGDTQLTSEDSEPHRGDVIIHHPHGALSRREIYGESWQRRTAMVVRHRDLHQSNL